MLSSFLFVLYPTWEFIQRIVFYYLWHHDFAFFILEEYCKRKGKEYNLCGCEKTCDNPSGSCAGQCKEGCFCKRGKVLNTQGECEANSNCGCIYKGKKYKVSPIRPCYLPWGARVAQWLEHSRPPMWPGFKSCVEVICGLSLLLHLYFVPRVFWGNSGFPLSSKTNISKFQFDGTGQVVLTSLTC